VGCRDEAPGTRRSCRRECSRPGALGLIVVVSIPFELAKEFDHVFLFATRDEFLQSLGDSCLLRTLAANFACLLDELRVDRKISCHLCEPPHTSVRKGDSQPEAHEQVYGLVKEVAVEFEMREFRVTQLWAVLDGTGIDATDARPQHFLDQLLTV
jgi:hypothetical protein